MSQTFLSTVGKLFERRKAAAPTPNAAPAAGQAGAGAGPSPAPPSPLPAASPPVAHSAPVSPVPPGTTVAPAVASPPPTAAAAPAHSPLPPHPPHPQAAHGSSERHSAPTALPATPVATARKQRMPPIASDGPGQSSSAAQSAANSRRTSEHNSYTPFLLALSPASASPRETQHAVSPASSPDHASSSAAAASASSTPNSRSPLPVMSAPTRTVSSPSETLLNSGGSASAHSSPRVGNTRAPAISEPQKRAVSDPLTTLLQALHLHQLVPTNLNCGRPGAGSGAGHGAADSSEEEEEEEEEFSAEVLDASEMEEASAAVAAAAAARAASSASAEGAAHSDEEESLVGRIGSDVGIHRQHSAHAPHISGVEGVTPPLQSQHGHMLFPRPLPLSSPIFVPTPAAVAAAAEARAAAARSPGNVPSSHSSFPSLHTPLSLSSGIQPPPPVQHRHPHPASVVNMIRSAKYATVGTLLQAAGHSLPAPLRTHMEKNLILYKIEQGRAAAAANALPGTHGAAANNNNSTSSNTGGGQPASARGLSTWGTEMQPLHRSQSMQPPQQQVHHASTTPPSPVLQPEPSSAAAAGPAAIAASSSGAAVAPAPAASTGASAAPSGSQFFSMKSLFQSPSSSAASPSQVHAVAGFPPPTLHPPLPSALDPLQPSYPHHAHSGSAAVSPVPVASASAPAAAAAGSTSPSLSSIRIRKEGEPEHPLSHARVASGAGSPSSASAPATSASEEDGHWSTYASRRVKNPVKKPSNSGSPLAAAAGVGGSSGDLHSRSLTPSSHHHHGLSENALAQLAPLQLHGHGSSVGSSSGLFDSVSRPEGAPSARSTSESSLPEDDGDAEGRRAIEQGLSKLAAQRGSTGGPVTLSAPPAATTALLSPGSTTAAAASGAASTPGSTASSTASPAFSPLPTSSAAPASLWSVADVRSFLDGLGLGAAYGVRFEQSLIDGEALLELSEEDLVELGVADKFHRRKLAKKIKVLVAAAAADTNSTNTTGVSMMQPTLQQQHSTPTPHSTPLHTHPVHTRPASISSPPVHVAFISPPAGRHMSHSSVSVAPHAAAGVGAPAGAGVSPSAAARRARSGKGGTFASLPAPGSAQRAALAGVAPFFPQPPSSMMSTSEEDEDEGTGSGSNLPSSSASAAEAAALLGASAAGLGFGAHIVHHAAGTGAGAADAAAAAASAATALAVSGTSPDLYDAGADPLYVSNVEVENILRILEPYQRQLQAAQQRRAAAAAAAAARADQRGSRDQEHDASLNHTAPPSSTAAITPPPPPLLSSQSTSSASSSSSHKSHSNKKSKHKQAPQQPSPPADNYHDWLSSDDPPPQPRATSLSQSSIAPPSSHVMAAAGPTIAAIPAPSASASSSSASLAPPHHLTIIDLAEIAGLRHLNEGAGGVALVGVYRNEFVVVKQPKKAIIGSEEWLELQLHMKLPPHERLVEFLGISMVAQQMYFVTRFIERGSLKSLLMTEASLGGDELRAYYAHPLHCISAAIQIAEGLIHLHSHHVVHRDVSARNILVSKEGNHIVSDLGLSRWMEKRPVTANQAAGAGAASGDSAAAEGAHSPKPDATVDQSAPPVVYEDIYSMNTLTALPARWTAPECLRSQVFTEKSDVYSLGLTIYEMASGGALPYAQLKDNLQVIAGVVLGELELLPLPCADTHPAQAEVIMMFVRRCMMSVEQRPTMPQIKAEMEAWLRMQQAADQQWRRQIMQQQQQPLQPAEHPVHSSSLAAPAPGASPVHSRPTSPHSPAD